MYRNFWDLSPQQLVPDVYFRIVWYSNDFIKDDIQTYFFKRSFCLLNLFYISKLCIVFFPWPGTSGTPATVGTQHGPPTPTMVNRLLWLLTMCASTRTQSTKSKSQADLILLLILFNVCFKICGIVLNKMKIK